MDPDPAISSSNHTATGWWRQILTLLKGASLAQGLPLLVTPVITRLFSQAEFGILGIFVAGSAILAVVFTGGYDQAIVLPRSDRRARSVLGVVILIALGMLIISLLILAILEITGMTIPVIHEIDNFIWLLPASAAAIALSNGLTQFHLRSASVGRIANSHVLKASSLVLIQLSALIANFGALTLVFSRLISNWAQFTLLSKDVITKNLRNRITSLRDSMQIFSKFPRYTMWGNLANIAGIYLVTILVGSIYPIDVVGNFSLVQRILTVPIIVASQALGQVYYRSSVKEMQRTGSARSSFIRSMRLQAGLAVGLGLILFSMNDRILEIVFGQGWGVLSSYIHILTPLFMVRMLANPVSHTMITFQRQEIMLLWQVTYVCIIICIFLFAAQQNYAIEQTLKLYSMSIGLMYVIQLFLSWRLARGRS